MLLAELGCELIHINGEPNGQFAHAPEPIAEHLGGLCEAVKEHKADIGFAQDHPALFTFLFGQLPTETPEPPTASDSPHPDDAFAILYSRVQSAMDNGIIRATVDDPAMTISYTLWALVHGMAVLRATRLINWQFDFDTADRFAMETLVRGLVQTGT